MSRKPKAEPAWKPPVGLKIEVCVSRGDAFFKAEATPSEALNIARMLTVMARTLTSEAPDLLPHADSVPGGALPYDWAEEYYEGRARGASAPRRKGLGF